MEIIKIRIKDIKPYEGNAKKHPAEQIRQIEESIREFGNNDPIAVDESNVIIEGHGRYIALRNLGYEEAECIVLKGLTEEQKNAYRLVHNQLTMNSGWDMETHLICVRQDQHLSKNQERGVRCGDNGIFKGVPLSREERKISKIARKIYESYPTDGKYILDGERIIICQSNADEEDLKKRFPTAEINPLGHWTGGTDVDAGATNRKLGSDMARSVTGGGLHGKDLSKADVSVNIYAFLKAQETRKEVSLCCAIGDGTIDGRPYQEIVDIARRFIEEIGGFERFAEWGLY